MEQYTEASLTSGSDETNLFQQTFSSVTGQQ